MQSVSEILPDLSMPSQLFAPLSSFRRILFLALVRNDLLLLFPIKFVESYRTKRECKILVWNVTERDRCLASSRNDTIKHIPLPQIFHLSNDFERP